MTSTVKIPEGWIETIVESLVNDKILEKPMDGNHGNLHPKSSDFTESGVPFIMASDISNGKVDFKNCYYISEATNNTLQKGFAKPGDVLLTHKATIGKVALLGGEYPSITLTPQVTYYRVLNHDKLDNKYLYYYFLSPYFQNIFAMWSGAGSTRAYLGITDQRKLPIILPPLPEQKAIAGVLSGFDDKIELLRAENQTLEEMGQTLFKERFGKYKVGDELPDGWKVGKLGDYCETVLGGTPSREKNEYWGGNIPWINSGKVNENRIVEASEYITEEGLSKSATKLMPKGTVLIAITGATLGQYSILCIDSCFNQSVVGIRESEKFKKEFLYYFIGATIKDLINNQTGGAQQHINKQVVDNHNMIIPTDEILEKYYEISEPIFNKITENLFQIESLSKTRDQLLPKLMSGEVRVEL